MIFNEGEALDVILRILARPPTDTHHHWKVQCLKCVKKLVWRGSLTVKCGGCPELRDLSDLNMGNEVGGFKKKRTVKVVKTSPGLKTASTNVMRAAENTHSGSSGALLACWFNTFAVRTDAAAPFSKQQVHWNTNPDSSIHVHVCKCALYVPPPAC